MNGQVGGGEEEEEEKTSCAAEKRVQHQRERESEGTSKRPNNRRFPIKLMTLAERRPRAAAAATSEL